MSEPQSPSVHVWERVAGFFLASVVVVAFLAYVFNPPKSNDLSLPLIRFLAAFAAALSAYLFGGSLDVGGRVARTSFRAAGAFAAFIAVFFLFLYGIPQSSTPVSPQPNEKILPSPSVELPSRSDSIPNRTSEPSQILNELYGKIEQGREQLQNKNFGLARTEFKAAQALDNQHPLPLFYIGITYDRGGNIDEADRNYEEAGEKYLAFQGKSGNLRLYDYDALIELSHVFNKDKKHESALKLSSLALELQGISPNKRYAAYATKGTSLFWLDRSESDRLEARDAFVDALEIKDSHLVRYNLGSLYAKLLKDNPNAEKEYSRALQLKPDFKQALRDLGFLYIIMNRLPEAESMFQQIQGDALAQEGLQIVSSLRTDSQANSTVLSDIQRLGIFGSLTVHDFEQDPVLKDEHDHDHEDHEET